MPPVKKAAVSNPQKDAIDQTVIYSDKNLYFEGYGHIDKGFSVIKKEKLDIYLIIHLKQMIGIYMMMHML